jgi:NAD(P)-dependent dehydrogenase (short-subunit alcohol dehydrogenase family)
MKKQWQEIAERAVARFGKVHMVVNNAGVTGDAGGMYIFTHASYRSAIQKRFSAIDAAFESAVQSPLLQNIGNQ